MDQIKTDAEIKIMREGGKILATILKETSQAIVAGMTTKDVSKIASQSLKKLGGEPAFLGYGGFPDIICVSVNDEVVHGIPGNKIIKDGDIVSLDFGVKYLGMVTDAACSLIVGGESSALKDKIISVTERSLYAGISVVKAGAHVGDIGASVQSVLESEGLGVVRDLIGHGVGHALHESPNVPNYGVAGTGPILRAGMTIAIEPMSTLGSYKIYTADDGWTVCTLDGSLSAHFEHTILVTNSGSDILTKL
jgi:methionyl aminopeptidase